MAAIRCVVALLAVAATASENRTEATRHAEHVKRMFYHGWNSYLEYGFPSDELTPLTCAGRDTWGSYALTMVDTLDTLYILGNYSEFDRAVDEVVRNVHFAIDRNVSVFETNIRVVGGLLAGHVFALERQATTAASPPYDGALLEMARDLGDRLLPAFDTPTGIPYGTVNLLRGVPPGETTITSLAGAGTYLIEFGMLTRLTNDTRYEKAARGSMRAVWARRSQRDLVGNHIDVRTGKWTLLDSGIGPNQDSFYEYLLKAYVLFGDLEYLAMFETFYHSIVRYMKQNHWYVDVNMERGSISLPWFTALGGFWPGLQTLYGDLAAAAKTLHTFQEVWRRYGFVPEALDLTKGSIVGQLHGYFLRPEMVESTMYLHQATRDPVWTAVGLEYLASIEHSAWTPCGYAIVQNVTTHALGDRMESFYLSETLKYMYLLFDADHPFHSKDFVFSTEGHPFQITAATRDPRFWGEAHGVGKGSSGATLADRIHRAACPRKQPATWIAQYGLDGQVTEASGPAQNTAATTGATEQTTPTSNGAVVDGAAAVTSTAPPVASPTWPSKCSRDIGVDLEGNDLLQASVVNAHLCAQLCQGLPVCNAFTYTASDKQCHIKSGAEGRKACSPDHGTDCATVVSGVCSKSQADIAKAVAQAAAAATAASSLQTASPAVAAQVTSVAVAQVAAAMAAKGADKEKDTAVLKAITASEVLKNRVDLLSKCFVIKGSAAKTWWSYEVCFGRAVTQFREGDDKSKISLGQREMAEQIRSAPFHQVQDIADGLVNESAAPAAIPPAANYHVVSQHFVNGAYCTPGPKDPFPKKNRRETVVHFFCNPKLTDGRFAYDVSEPRTCEYAVNIVSRLLCGITAAVSPEA